MSVHGQVKIRTSAEQRLARERERAVKLERYSTQCDHLLTSRQSADVSTLLKQTEEILVDHPDCFTLWNIRRQSLLQLPQDPQEQYQQCFEKELQITQLCLRSNPKSYSCWFQRQWILQQLKVMFNVNLYQEELQLCKKYLG